MSEVLSIVINNNVMRMALLNKVRGGIRVRRLIERECPEGMVDDSVVKDPEALAGFIRLQLNNANVKARDVIFTIPADKVMTREITLPDLSDTRIRQIVDTNAAEYFPINLDDYVISFYRIASVRPADEGGQQPGQESGDRQEDAGDEALSSDDDIEITDFGKKEEPAKKKGLFGGLKKAGKAGKAGRREKTKGKRGDKSNKGSISAKKGEEKSEGAESEDNKGGRRKRGEIRVMAIAAPNDMISALYETAEQLHVRVESIDFIGNSIYQLARLQVGDEPTLTVDISGDHTALTFFDSGDMIMQRNIDFGLDQIVDIVAREKWVSPERADEMLRTTTLIDDELPQNNSISEPLYFAIDMIRRTMMYYTRNRGMRPMERVLLMGDAVYYRGMRDLIESQLSVPVSSVEQLKGVGIPRTALMHDQAMRFLDNYGATIQPVGFLSQELTEEKKKAESKKIYRGIIIGSVVVSAVMIAIPSVEYVRLRNESDELKKQVSALSDADSVLNAYEQAKLRNDDVRNVEGTTASNNDRLSAFITALEAAKPKGLSIENLAVDEGEITMTVHAAGKDIIAAMLRQLEGIDDISEVEAGALTSYYDDGRETTTCTITCMLTSKEKRDYEETRTQEASGN